MRIRLQLPVYVYDVRMKTTFHAHQREREKMFLFLLLPLSVAVGFCWAQSVTRNYVAQAATTTACTCHVYRTQHTSLVRHVTSLAQSHSFTFAHTATDVYTHTLSVPNVDALAYTR